MKGAVSVLAVELVATGAAFEKNLKAASSAVSHTANRFDQFNKAAQKASHRGNEAGAAMESLTARMFLGAGAVGAAVGAIVALETALIGVAAASVSAFAEFDGTMTRVASITGETAAGMRLLTAEVQRINETSPLSGQELASGLEMLAQGGLSASQAMIALESTQKIAVVANTDMAKAADITTNAINQFGVTASELPTILDAMALATTRSNTNLTQLGVALNYAAGAATGAGYEINETVGALAAFANVGYKASMGGTALRGSISRLLDPTAEAAKVMDSMSLSVQDAAGKLRPMSDILEQLVHKQATTGEVFSIFGQRAGGAMLALMANGYKSVDMLRELERATGDSAGTLDKMFGVQAQSLENKIKAAESAFENLKIQIGSALEPAVASAADSLQKLFTALANNKGLIDAVGYGVAALVVGFQGLTWGVQLAATVYFAFNAVLVIAETALRLVAGALGTLIGLAALAVSPILLLIDLFRTGGEEMTLFNGAVDLFTSSLSTLGGALGWMASESAAADESMGQIRTGMEGARGAADDAMNAFARMNAQLADTRAKEAVGQSFQVLGHGLILIANKVEEAWTKALNEPFNMTLRKLDQFGKNYAKGWRDIYDKMFPAKPADKRGFDDSRKPIPKDGAGGSGVSNAMNAAMSRVSKAQDKGADAIERITKELERFAERLEKAQDKASSLIEQALEKAARAAQKEAQQREELLNWKKYYQKPNEIYRTANAVSGFGAGFEGVSGGVSQTASELTRRDETMWLTEQLKIEDSLIEREKIRNQLLEKRLQMQNEHLRLTADGMQATFTAIGQEIQLVGVLVDKNSTQKEVTEATVGLMSNLGSVAATAMQAFGASAKQAMMVQATLNALMAITALGMGLMAAPLNPVAAGSYFAAAATLGGKSIGGFIGAGMAGEAQSEFVAPVREDAQTREDAKRDMREAFIAALEAVGLDELAKREIMNNYYLYDPVASSRTEIQARNIQRQAERAKTRTL